MNVLYKRQLAILLFIVGLVFKLSKLPALLVGEVGSSAHILVALYLLIDFCILCVILKLINIKGMQVLEQQQNQVLYKILMCIMSLYFVVKLCLVYGGTVLFVMEQLFENIATIEITFTLLVPILYLALKGIRTIARTAEILIWYIGFVLLLNFVFIRADFDFSRNLPFFTDSISSLLLSSTKYMLWFGDFTPFLFILLKDNKKPYVGIAMIALSAVLILSFIFMNAIYGVAVKYVANFIVKLASFNQFAAEIGRLDWTGMIAWLMMAILYLSTFVWAAGEAFGKVIGKPKLAVVIVVGLLLIVQIVVKDMQKIVEMGRQSYRFIAILGSYIIPIVLLVMAMLAIRKQNKIAKTEPISENENQTRQTRDRTATQGKQRESDLNNIEKQAVGVEKNKKGLQPSKRGKQKKFSW